MAKVAVWSTTGSGALLAEALHSAADVGNQLLLRAGVASSRRAPTQQHPYGFHKEKYIYALMSAVGIFCIGAGASVVHGIQGLFAPPHLDNMGLSLGVLFASSAAELYSLRVAFQGIRESAQDQGLTVLQFIRKGRDPTTLAILAEDAGAVAGLGIATAATCLTWATGHAAYDAAGSVAIGTLMGGIAVALIRNNMRFLRGQAMDADLHERVFRHLSDDPVVVRVIDAKSEAVGDGVYRFKAEIQWNGDAIVKRYLERNGRQPILDAFGEAIERGQNERTSPVPEEEALETFGRGVIRTVGEEIDRLEGELKRLVPGLVYVDLETDKGKVPLDSHDEL